MSDKALKESKLMLDNVIRHFAGSLTGRLDDPFGMLGMLVAARYALDEVEVAPPEAPPMPEIKPLSASKPPRKRRPRGEGAVKNTAWFTPCPTCGVNAEQPCIRSVSNIHGETGEPTKYLHRTRGLGNGAIPNSVPQ